MSFLSVIRPHVVVRCKLSTVRSVNNSTIILLTLLEDRVQTDRATTPTRAGLRRWHRPRHAARLAARARSSWRDSRNVYSVAFSHYDHRPWPWFMTLTFSPMRAHKAQGHRSVDSKDKSRNGHASGRLDERYNFYLPVCSENVELVYTSTVHGCIWYRYSIKDHL